MDNLNLQFLRCEDEPIHIPSKIQPFGYLFTVEKDSKNIIACSENIAVLGLEKNGLYNQDITKLLKPIDRYIELFLQKHTMQGREIYFDVCFDICKQKEFDLVISLLDKHLIVELIEKDLQNPYDASFDFKTAVNELITSNTVEQIYEIVVKNVKKLTGYDRVMLYKFDKDYNGKVISEAKKEQMPSYLNLHYPSSDIPAQARRLYLINPIRMIYTTDYTPNPIASIEKEPVDMSLSFLRSVSPIHLQYMQNMGVQASMTISIIIEGKLWGLIACHHSTPFFPSIQTMKDCEDIAASTASLIDIYQKKENETQKSKFLGTVDTIVTVLKQKMTKEDVTEFISRNLRMFQPIFNADGVVFVHLDSIDSCCVELSDSELEKFVQTVIEINNSELFYTNSLAKHCSLSENTLKMCAGVLCIKLPVFERSFLIFTRKEQIEKIDWGGDPSKAGQTLNPRKSFEKFSQTIVNKSIPWSVQIDEKIDIFYKKLEDLFLQQSSYKALKAQEDLILSLQQQKIRNYNQLIEMLVTMIEQRDAYTAGHTQRVAYYCKLIAQKMGFNKEDVDLVEQAAKLHDIGKISIPDSILLKPGRLNKNEYHLIKQHLDVGYSILQKIDSYKEIAKIMVHHHEKYDGTGYPDGKKGDEIPLLSHIMIVSDALDAMTTNRIYQSRKTLEEAVEEIKVLKGVWYHPDVVDAVESLYKQNQIQPSDASQMPLTTMEYERFSYFFKDQLTSFFNESYLWLLLKGALPNKQIEKYVMIETKGVTKYNKVHGWNRGNKLIQEISEYIQKITDFGEYFRVFGDDFIVGFETELGKRKFLQQWKDYKHEEIYTVMQDIDKEAVTAALKTYW